MSKLYVGKIVHYMSLGSTNGEYLPETRAAIVTQIITDTVVGVTVINPTGFFFHPSLEFSETLKPGHWSFIPEDGMESTSTSTVEQVTQILPEPNFAPTLDTTTFPDEDAEYNEPSEQITPTLPDSSEAEICGMRKYVSPIASPGSDQGDYCVKDRGHDGDHESWSGMTWPNFQ